MLQRHIALGAVRRCWGEVLGFGAAGAGAVDAAGEHGGFVQAVEGFAPVLIGSQHASLGGIAAGVAEFLAAFGELFRGGKAHGLLHEFVGGAHIGVAFQLAGFVAGLLFVVEGQNFIGLQEAFQLVRQLFGLIGRGVEQFVDDVADGLPGSGDGGFLGFVRRFRCF